MALPEDTQGQLSPAAWPKVWKTIQEFHPDVIAVGPGLGTGSGASRVVIGLARKFSGGLVVDADALNILSMQRSKPRFVGSVVMTPHEGECGRLLGMKPEKISARRESAARDVATKFNSVCLLKGAGTLVTDGRTVLKNMTGNPAMASGGMGDVLTGMIAALWGQMPRRTKETGLRAAAIGAYLHGLAADSALKKFPEKTMLASDLVSFFPTIFKHVFRRTH
jgi:NAD(P)H-hydrate epimerase